MYGKPWQAAETATIAADPAYFSFEPGAKWHGFAGYDAGRYLVDPCKLLLTTPGIDATSGEYTRFGIPATILANYLRENGIVPEKCDLNSILFLLTPAETPEKWRIWWRCWSSLNSTCGKMRCWPKCCRACIAGTSSAIRATRCVACAGDARFVRQLRR